MVQIVINELQKIKSSSVALESTKDNFERSLSNSSIESVSTTSSSCDYVDAFKGIAMRKIFLNLIFIDKEKK
ncbi:MAG: hypothetical protein HEEMFOPI_02049 [Holosporales bacterium]